MMVGYAAIQHQWMSAGKVSQGVCALVSSQVGYLDASCCALIRCILPAAVMKL